MASAASGRISRPELGNTDFCNLIFHVSPAQSLDALLFGSRRRPKGWIYLYCNASPSNPNDSVDSQTCLSWNFWLDGFLYFIVLFLPPIFLHSSPDFLGSLLDFFPISTSRSTKKATDGTRLLDSLAAPLDLSAFFSGLLGVKSDK